MLPSDCHSRPVLEGRRAYVEDQGELCLAEEVERLRRLGLSDEEIAGRMGVDVSWVETLVSPEGD